MIDRPVFGRPLPASVMRYPRRIRIMWQAYGQADGLTCGQCPFLVRHRYHLKTYFKCSMSTVTAGAATDWRFSWPACGKAQEGERDAIL